MFRLRKTAMIVVMAPAAEYCNRQNSELIIPSRVSFRKVTSKDDERGAVDDAFFSSFTYLDFRCRRYSRAGAESKSMRFLPMAAYC